MTPLTV